jgi:hypothetical protein
MTNYTAFHGTKLLHAGSLADVVLKVKRHADTHGQNDVLIFSDESGKCMDFRLEGTEAQVLHRLEIYTATEGPAAAPPGPGRPRLGVASREVSLLPRHWDWLATQPGGASNTLRKLVEEARKKTPDARVAQERAYRFMQSLAGDLEGYEEALRALYRKDKETFSTLTQAWPKDVRDHATLLAGPAFTDA